MASMLQKLTYRIDSEIEIEATPEQVWKVFGDFASWGKWNDFMELPVVPERAGKHCRVLFHLDGGCMKESPHDPEVRSCCLRAQRTNSCHNSACSS
jgi:hypothetical protein